MIKWLRLPKTQRIHYQDFAIAIQDGSKQVLESPIDWRPADDFELPYDETKLEDLLSCLEGRIEGQAYNRVVSQSREQVKSLAQRWSRGGQRHVEVVGAAEVHHLRESTPGEQLAANAGQTLYMALFSGRIHDCLQQSLAFVRAHPRQGLRIRLVFGVRGPGPDHVAAMPWELLQQPGTTHFLALEPETPIVRELQTPAGTGGSRRSGFQDIGPRLRILAAIGQQKDPPELDLPGELERIEEALGDQVVIERCLANFDELRNTLKLGRHHVLHFMGHGDFAEEEGGGWSSKSQIAQRAECEVTAWQPTSEPSIICGWYFSMLAKPARCRAVLA